MRKKRKNKKSRFFLYFIISALFIVTTGLTLVYISLPNVEKLKGSIKINRKIKEKDNWVSVPYIVGEQNKNFVPLSSISKHLVHAVIVAEDIEFYGHNGFNYDEIIESVKKNIRKARFARGASTITQQLMKNIYLSGEKSFWRKLVEAFLTYKAEKVLSKNRILELYLNVIEWGDGIYGIGQASWKYFGKPPSSLTIEDSAYLASLIPAPKIYSHARPGSKMARYLEKRKNTIMWLMSKAGYVESQEEIPQIASKPATSPSLEQETSGRAEIKKEITPVPKPTISENEEKELFDMIENFQPEEAFKETKSPDAPAKNEPVAK